MSTPRGTVALALGCLLLLAGCAPDPVVPEETPTVSPTLEASAEPTPVVAGPPAPDDLVLRVDGLGSLVIGEPAPAPDDPGAMILFDVDVCVSDASGVGPGDPGAGAWVGIPLYVAGPEGGSLFGVEVDEAGIVQGVQVFGLDEIPTEAGIRVGSTLDELLAAYPGISSPGGGSGISQFYLVDGPGGRLVFEVAAEFGGVVGYWDPALLGTVLGMTAVPAGTPGFTIAGSDGGLGGCPL
jgi:hypothetical protein